MTPEEYIKLAKLTDVPRYAMLTDRIDSLVGSDTAEAFHAMLGIASESGEFVDAFKKYLMYGKPIDYVNLDEEIGDLLWYIALYLHARNKSFSSIMEQNIAKLKARYPDKFSEEAALNRNLDKERKVLEDTDTK